MKRIWWAWLLFIIGVMGIIFVNPSPIDGILLMIFNWVVFIGLMHYWVVPEQESENDL